MNPKLCLGKAKPVLIELTEKQLKALRQEDTWSNRHAVRGVKRIKMKCELCGAKVTSSISSCHDGCCASHVMPPHKPKGWWKK